MDACKLIKTAQQLGAHGKGILAADESASTIKKRLDTIQVESTEENRRAYRALLFSTPTLEQYISGVILFEETLYQKNDQGDYFPAALLKRGILPGIKVDKGLVALANAGGQKTTQGLDGLEERLAKYKETGIVFAKWRAVYNISNTLPSMQAIHSNSEGLARYAAICQQYDIVPIVEPEILIDGDHTIERCAEVSERVFAHVFKTLRLHKVLLEGIVLKPSMVISGESCANQASPEAVAEHTVRILKRTVPSAVPSINFLSGGQTPEQATLHLDLMNKLGNLPWNLSFSYGRALQDPCLKAWQGKTNQVRAAQAALAKRSQLNSLAAKGKYAAKMEETEPSLT